jgi:hypothetical protein
VNQSHRLEPILTLPKHFEGARIFEAIALRTALILFEGTYSGVVVPNLHYIPLKKDLSNFDEVLKQLADDEYLERLTQRAWDDIVGSGRYSYRAFIEMVDATIDRHAYRGTGTSLLTAVVATRGTGDRHWHWRPTDRALATFSAFATELIDFEQQPPGAIPVAFDAKEAALDAMRGRVPLDPVQAIKWIVADVLHRRPVLYRFVRVLFRMVRFILRPVRLLYRGLAGLFRRASRSKDRSSVEAPKVTS